MLETASIHCKGFLDIKSLYSKVTWQERGVFFFFFEIPVCKKNEWCSEYHMTFPDVIVMMLSDMGTVPRWTDLNASAAKLIFPSSRKFCHCCFLTFVFFAVVLKLFIVWFQVGTVKRNFISSTYYYFENNLVNIFLVLGELCPWGELALQRSFRPPRPPMFLIEGKNGICIITDCIKRMHSQDFFFFFFLHEVMQNWALVELLA